MSLLKLSNPVSVGLFLCPVFALFISLLIFMTMRYRRKWQPTPVFLLKNFKDRGARRATVYGSQNVGQDLVTKQQQCQYNHFIGSLRFCIVYNL